LIVEELPPAELRHRLEHAGLRLRIGPVVAEIRSPFDIVRTCVDLHYAAHEVVTADVFADFHVSVQAPRGLRRWLKPEVMFMFERASAFQPLPADQAFAVLEWGLNWAIAAHCHQYLMIHSAVVEKHGSAMLLSAPPGSGKSTLCAALVARGWRLLSDELALLDIETKRVVPIPRPISLKNRSIETIGAFWPEAPMSPIVQDTLKGAVAHVQPPAPDVRLSALPAKPRWVVLPRYSPDHGTELRTLSRSAAFMQLVDNAFNYSTHGRAGFEFLADVVDECSCFEFHYGGDLDEAVRIFDDVAR
jgi:HprK-related kinase A